MVNRIPEHDDDSDMPVWAGMPDPHRHNPYLVGVVLVVFAAVVWLGTAAVVLSLIAGVLR